MSPRKRLPSINLVLQSAATTAARFPLALLCAFAGTAIAVFLVDNTGHEWEPLGQQLLMTCALGLPLFIALTTCAESRNWSIPQSLGVYLVGVAALALYAITLPEEPFEVETAGIRFALLALGLHFLVAWLPFARSGKTQGFWQYNKTLLLRYLVAALFAAVLHLGLIIALAAADHLFGMDVEGVRYLQIWILTVGVFQTWFFLSGVPDDFAKLNRADEFPRGLKVLAQFILLPLVGLYLAILYAYEVKIIVEWNWPRGWVSELILWYAVVGILSLLLLYPLRNKAENRWITIFSRWYFLALVPLVVMLVLAITRRITDYGVTEPRYFVAALALGLSVVVLYFIFGKAKDIRIVPIVLCALALGSAYGPWSAFAVSRNSQQSRLEALLIETGLLQDGELRKTTEPIDHEKNKQMSSIADYLATRHGSDAFAPWLKDNVLKHIDTTSRWSRGKAFAEVIGFQYQTSYNMIGVGRESKGQFRLTVPRGDAISISGYDFLIDNVRLNENKKFQNFDVTDRPLKVRLDDDQLELILSFTDVDTTARRDARISLGSLIPELLDSAAVGSDFGSTAEQPFVLDEFEGVFVFSTVHGDRDDDKMTLNFIKGRILLRMR